MHKAKKLLYIAYGSNLNLEQMTLRCPTAEVVGKSVLKGWRLLFRGGSTGSVATIERFRGSIVPILVWQLQPHDEAALDRYEGWPHLYRKEALRVKLNGKSVDAMIYIMNESRPYGSPSPSYFNTIRDGYVDAGFDISILQRATFDSLIEANKTKYSEERCFNPVKFR